MNDPWGISGRTILITGSSTGIGAGLSEAFLSAGASVIGVSRTQGSLDHSAFRAVQADLASREGTLSST